MLVIGESLIDVIVRPHAPVSERVGGSPLNVAVGLSRLGPPVALLTMVGSDEHGAMIERHLAVDDVELVAGSLQDGPTSTATARIGDDGAATYEFDVTWDLPTPAALGQPRLVHLGSIGAVVDPGASTVADLLATVRSTATVSYDPNVRPVLMGDRADACARIEAVIAGSDVVKASSEDVDWLHPDLSLDEVGTRWLDLGPAVVVITLGEGGAHAFSRTASARIDAAPTALVDTIGAGDSFMAGLLVALDDLCLLGRDREDSLRAIDSDGLRRILAFAASCAAVTVGREGADPPTRDEVSQ